MYHLLSDVTILLIRSTLRSQHCTPQLFFLLSGALRIAHLG